MRRFVLVFPLLCSMLLGAVAPSEAQESGALAVRRYADVLGTINARLSTADRMEYAERILLLASYYRIDPRLLVALVGVESTWRARVVSGAGARGFGQLTPPTAAELDVDAFEPSENLDGTARYLRRFLNRYAGGDERTRYGNALAAYNAGPGAVARFGGIPPYAETRAYVRNVLAMWSSLRGRLTPMRAQERIALARGPSPAAAPLRLVRRVPPRARATAVAALRLVSSSPHVVAVHLVPKTLSVHAPPAVIARIVPPARAVRVASRELASIVLRAPARILEGTDIPIDVRAAGLRRLRIVAKIGPTVLDQRSFTSPAHHVVLHAPPVVGDSRVVTVRAFAPGFRSSETIVVTVPERPSSTALTAFGVPSTGVAVR